MKTEIIRTWPGDRDLDKKISPAALAIREGKLVAFPTETVYGLGADALNAEAVKRIFEAKGRPQDNPLIVHIAHEEGIYNLAREVPRKAKDLIDRFWPGPLTLILKKSPIIPDRTTAGLDTVAIRMPSHPIARKLILLSERPIAAPSANTSGKPSPTTGKHVIDDLYGKVEYIIDGGPTNVGLESTVIDLTTDPPMLLRPGGVTLGQLEEVLGKVDVHPAVFGKRITGNPRSPGMKYRHYAPDARLILVEGPRDKVVKRINEMLGSLGTNKIGVLAVYGEYNQGIVVNLGKSTEEVARKVFDALRDLDRRGADIIIAEGIPDTELGLAVMNRLRKAASEIIKL
uniref:Threonylcarbamoyl-AMP synthase n=1 Tax=uncultured euryarchaeote Alv-FOS5 TaxID=337891 RepID=Q3SBA8_9EURY|nr:putative translation factor [uncultured euryarchaeote Alv-FOS5]